MEEAASHLTKALKETAGSRFLAAKRLQYHDKRLTRLIAFTSAYIIALTILPYFIRVPTNVMDFYNLVIVAFSVVILFASLLQYSSGNVVNAEQHHRSALEINGIRHRLLAEDVLTSQVTADYTNKYNSVLQKYSINHERLDYQQYQLERPEDYPWLKPPARIWIAVRLFATAQLPNAFLAAVTIIFVVLMYYGISR